MGLMSDIFKRGYPFASATGLKTGANLEDLATRACPVSGTQLVDQETLEDFADPVLVDDDAEALRRLRIKDGGVTAGKIADGAVLNSKLWLGDPLALTTGMFTSTMPSLTTQASWANAIDGDFDTMTAESTVGTTRKYFWLDLGAIYMGIAALRYDMDGHCQWGANMTCYDSVPLEGNKSHGGEFEADSGYSTRTVMHLFHARRIMWTFTGNDGINVKLKFREVQVFPFYLP